LVNVQDGSFSDLGELDPTLSWSAGTMSGDVEIEYGIEASARPNSVVDANNDGTDLDIHLEASAGDGFAVKTVSVVKGIDADGARVTFEPRYNYGNRTTTIVTDGKQGGEFVALISQIHREAEAADTDFDKEKVSMKDDDERIGAGILMKTLSNLSMQVATIASIVPSVSANETELKDKKLRHEDALNSMNSARELGIDPGGGDTLAHLQSEQDSRFNRDSRGGDRNDDRGGDRDQGYGGGGGRREEEVSRGDADHSWRRGAGAAVPSGGDRSSGDRGDRGSAGYAPRGQSSGGYGDRGGDDCGGGRFDRSGGFGGDRGGDNNRGGGDRDYNNRGGGFDRNGDRDGRSGGGGFGGDRDRDSSPDTNLPIQQGSHLQR
jgi:hypothetical protein